MRHLIARYVAPFGPGDGLVKRLICRFIIWRYADKTLAVARKAGMISPLPKTDDKGWYHYYSPPIDIHPNS